MAPVSKKDALSMLDGVSGAELLRGVRGAKGVDRAALADIIQKVSQLVNDFPEILEVDLNPIFATEKGATAVDVRIVVGDAVAATRNDSVRATFSAPCSES